MGKKVIVVPCNINNFCRQTYNGLLKHCYKLHCRFFCYKLHSRFAKKRMSTQLWSAGLNMPQRNAQKTWWRSWRRCGCPWSSGSSWWAKSANTSCLPIMGSAGSIFRHGLFPPFFWCAYFLACLHHALIMSMDGECSVGRASDWEARCNTDVGSSVHPWCGKGFLSQSQLSVQALLCCSHNLFVSLHASTSVCMLKIPNIGCHTIVWTHKNTTHTGRYG